jgi:hypothetical protein
MRPGASPASPLSPTADILDGLDVAVGTKVVPRGGSIRIGVLADTARSAGLDLAVVVAPG